MISSILTPKILQNYFKKGALLFILIPYKELKNSFPFFIESKKVFVKVKSVKEAKLKIEGHKKVKGHYPIPSLVHIMVFQDRVALIYEFEETVKEKDGGLFLDCLGLHPLEKEAFEKVIGIYIKSYKKNSTFKRLPSIFIFQR